MSALKQWLAPTRTALLLIDMQVDFASPDGAMAREGRDMTAPQAAVKNAARLAEAARKIGVLCVFARLITKPGEESATLKEWKKRRGRQDDALLCCEGTRGAEFVGPKPAGCEAVFSKFRYDPFAGTELDSYLRKQKRDTLVLAGLTTECCIDAAAREGFERDYHVFIAADAVAAYQPELHRATLQALALNCAILASAEDVIEAWKNQ